jgi:hypothetical protein
MQKLGDQTRKLTFGQQLNTKIGRPNAKADLWSAAND